MNVLYPKDTAGPSCYLRSVASQRKQAHACEIKQPDGNPLASRSYSASGDAAVHPDTAQYLQTLVLRADGSQPFDGNPAYRNMPNSASKDLLDVAISLPAPTSSGSEILRICEVAWIPRTRPLGGISIYRKFFANTTGV